MITPNSGFQQDCRRLASLSPSDMPTPSPPKGKLHHKTPGWVREGQTFHIRIRVERSGFTTLTVPDLARALLESVRFYHQAQRWNCFLFLLMPDHLHALLAFPCMSDFPRTIGAWKKYHTTHHGVHWQDGFFDHRIRNGKEFDAKAAYIRNNPVVKGLCSRSEDWPWVKDWQDMAE